ncbi:hypothetical protein AYI70_g341 [Smittium culicis]|uniref:Uncharacterized protein n=1 Tax=Smittium culicis TaxID=133412 RepID=A0A1R1YH34_9FUNG|nr:hypothetical protein AYI70_g341 [Smittium culicis]
MDNFSQDSYFTRSPEFSAAEKILLSFKEFDQEKLDKAIRDPAINDLNSNIRKLAYTLTVPGFSRNVLGIKPNDFSESVADKLKSPVLNPDLTKSDELPNRDTLKNTHNNFSAEDNDDGGFL